MSLILAVAIPAFFILMAVEAVVGKRYRLVDTLSNIGCGVVALLLDCLLHGGALAIYVALYQAILNAAAITELSIQSPWTWVVALIAVDFAHYWWHRTNHRLNFMWAPHRVHHQSPHFNLSVGLRVGFGATLHAGPFYMPLALLGIPVEVVAAAHGLLNVYQFWLHTELVGKLGMVEYLFVTPSHHRVHHGTNRQYIDKNFGALLIIWDRWFGTFEEEVERPVYGASPEWNPVRAQIQAVAWLVHPREWLKRPKMEPRTTWTLRHHTVAEAVLLWGVFALLGVAAYGVMYLQAGAPLTVLLLLIAVWITARVAVSDITPGQGTEDNRGRNEHVEAADGVQMPT